MGRAKKKQSSRAWLKTIIGRHWGRKEESYRERLLRHIRLEKPRYWFKERRLWQKIGLILCAFIIFIVGTMYGIAQWYIYSQRGMPVRWGVTFIPDYQQSFGLNPQDAMQAMIDDLGIRNFRLVSYWNDIEPTPGHFDFSQLDWEFAKADQVGARVSLTIGLRQPRWPECHQPSWVDGQPKSVWYPELKGFMGKVIQRYKNNPALDSYQLENEYFLSAFGECKDFSRDRLIDEAAFVKQQDPGHKLIISRSNNAIGLPIGQPTPDEFGVSVYKRVWDKTITHRYFEYPFPAWFYGFLAGAGKIISGKDMIIHELQAEPWPPTSIQDASIQEQNKSLDAKRLANRLKYGEATGMKEIYIWGIEWMYWRKVKFNDPSLWNVVKQEIQSQQCQNCY